MRYQWNVKICSFLAVQAYFQKAINVISFRACSITTIWLFPSQRCVSCLQVTEYAHRFNLSASLAASITRLSAWLSATILLAVLAVVSHGMHTLSATQSSVAVPDLVNAIRRPLLAVSVAAAAVLIASVPVSANLARKSKSQGPQRGRIAAAGPTAGMPRSTQSTQAGSSSVHTGEASLAGPDAVLSADSSSVALRREANPHETTGAVEGPAQQPDEETMSEPSTLPSSHSFTSQADSTPQTLSDMVDHDGQDAEQDLSITDNSSSPGGQESPVQQGPSNTQDSEANSERKKGFFRDIGTDCLPSRRQRLATCPKLYKRGICHPGRRHWPVHCLMHATPRHNTVYKHITCLRLH